MIHICNNFISSKVHVKLIRQLALSEQQLVVVPVRRKSDIGVNSIDDERVTVKYFRYPDLMKYFPLLKVFYISVFCSVLISRSIGNNREFLGMPILAHNFWSDGVPAFFCSVFLKLKYALVVRNTDINIFIPRLIYARPLMLSAIKRSEALIFVSAAHKDRFIRRWPHLYSASGSVKVIPNGVEQFWLDRSRAECSDEPKERVSSVLYAGKFDKNKNIRNIFLAVERVNDKYVCELVLVGGTIEQVKEICGISKLPFWLTVINWVDGTEKMAELMEKAKVFAMPSFQETFGLVYIEALCCGCSLIHSKGEGIDGFFDEGFIVGVDPESVDEIERAIDRLLLEFPCGLKSEDIKRVTKRFDWEIIAEEYRRSVA